MSEIESAEELAELWVRAGILDGVERTTVASDIRADRRRVLEMAAIACEDHLDHIDVSSYQEHQEGERKCNVADAVRALIEEVCK